MPKRWQLTMWAIIIEAEGFQVPHIHPSGWLSGVYYVAAAGDRARQADGQHAGWIEFGEPYRDIAAQRASPSSRPIEPSGGPFAPVPLLLLPPHPAVHVTAQQRISISFDVVPVR